jgi:hypothetical protein
MKTPRKLEKQFNRILDIKYENPNGGAYAYIQFLAYTRELLATLRSLRTAGRQMESIEGICWLFNEYLGARFTPRHKIIFEEKQSEMRRIFDSIRQGFAEAELKRPYTWKLYHAQAA